MVIMIATEDAAALSGLEGFLARHTPHQILAAGSLEAVEDVATEAEDLDVLLCARHFSTTDGLAVQEAMLTKFPSLYSGYLADVDHDSTLTLGPQDRNFGPSTSHYEVLNWIHELEKLPPPVLAQTQPITLPESLLGHTLGDYKILAKRSTFRRSESYHALQMSMNRNVVLERLKAEFQHDINAKRNFRALVRAQANVVHPSIATVFEAQETEEGEIFYTREFVRGQNLPELQAAETKLGERELLQLLRAAGDAMVYYTEREIPRYRLRPQHLFHGDDGLPRLANLATITQDAKRDDEQDLRVLAEAIAAISAAPAPALASLLPRMRGIALPAIRTWSTLAQAAGSALQQIAETTAAPPVPTGKIRTTAAKRTRLWSSLGAAAGVLALAVLGYAKLSPPKARKLDDMLAIPAGTAQLGEGPSVAIKAFWISKYEVTIAAYAEFLAAEPTLNPHYDHPEQPTTKQDHTPQNWADYFPAAQAGAKFKGHRITLNAPVLWADWWDAYAYAKWRGQRLPNDPEWEYVARGPEGQDYPWGREAAPSKANTGEDFSATNDSGGQADGYASWCEVDAKPDDRSAFGVVGLAGNVAEWTSTWDQHPDFPDLQAPVYRGGCFSQKLAPLSAQRWAAKSLNLAQPFIGFRTASDTPPST